MRVIMVALNQYGLVVGLHVSFNKSKLLTYTICNWQQLLSQGQIVSPNEMVTHLGYPLGWNGAGKA